MADDLTDLWLRYNHGYIESKLLLLELRWQCIKREGKANFNPNQPRVPHGQPGGG